jgi:RNA polymerase sigma factor (sigma-70 family)
MSTAQSISQWLAHLKEGNADAAQRLWERYAMRLVELARRRLKDAPKRVADEEDVAASVFHSLCRGAAAGRFQNVQNRDDLWWLLLAITKQKVADHVRRESAQKRGGLRTHTESRLRGNADDSKGFALDRLISDEPTPEFILMLEEQHARLLGLLRDDRLRQIAIFRIEGFTVPEIAEDLQVSTRSIERKLALIRGVWSKELQS